MFSAKRRTWNHRPGAQIDGRSILDTPSIGGILREFWCYECSQYVAVPTNGILPALAAPAVQYFEYSQHPQHIPECCECTKYLLYFFSKIPSFTPRRWEHLCSDWWRMIDWRVSCSLFFAVFLLLLQERTAWAAAEHGRDPSLPLQARALRKQHCRDQDARGELFRFVRDCFCVCATSNMMLSTEGILVDQITVQHDSVARGLLPRGIFDIAASRTAL